MKPHSNHPYHLVDYSPWPLTGSIGAMTLPSGMILWFHKNEMYLFMLGNLILILTMIQWWRDIVRESTYQGKHTIKVVNGLMLGMILFIISEVFFFISFFWGFFHSSLAPTVEIGMTWPPKGKTSILDKEKMSPFECGFNPMSSARTPFSIQFFLIAVLFLIFDIEIAIILPIIITLKWSLTSTWIITIMTFIIILIGGLYHEWNNGMLEWAE